MFRRSRFVIPRNTTHLAKRLAQPFSKQKLLRAARVMGPTLVALAFAGVAHAQGTMDFSGAQTLMTTFKTFAIYAGAIICFGGLIYCGNPHDEWEISRLLYPDSSVRFLVPECSAGEPDGSAL